MQNKLYELLKNENLTEDQRQELVEFGKLVVKECIKIIKTTPLHCAYTTYDSGVVQCTIDKCAQTVETYFKED